MVPFIPALLTPIDYAGLILGYYAVSLIRYYT